MGGKTPLPCIEPSPELQYGYVQPRDPVSAPPRLSRPSKAPFASLERHQERPKRTPCAYSHSAWSAAPAPASPSDNVASLNFERMRDVVAMVYSSAMSAAAILPR